MALGRSASASATFEKAKQSPQLDFREEKVCSFNCANTNGWDCWQKEAGIAATLISSEIRTGSEINRFFGRQTLSELTDLHILKQGIDPHNYSLHDDTHTLVVVECDASKPQQFTSVWKELVVQLITGVVTGCTGVRVNLVKFVITMYMANDEKAIDDMKGVASALAPTAVFSTDTSPRDSLASAVGRCKTSTGTFTSVNSQSDSEPSAYQVLRNSEFITRVASDDDLSCLDTQEEELPSSLLVDETRSVSMMLPKVLQTFAVGYGTRAQTAPLQALQEEQEKYCRSEQSQNRDEKQELAKDEKGQKEDETYVTDLKRVVRYLDPRLEDLSENDISCSKSRSPRNRKRLKSTKIKNAVRMTKAEMCVWGRMYNVPCSTWISPLENLMAPKPRDVSDDEWYKMVQACFKSCTTLGSLLDGSCCIEKLKALGVSNPAWFVDTIHVDTLYTTGPLDHVLEQMELAGIKYKVKISTVSKQTDKARGDTKKRKKRAKAL